MAALRFATDIPDSLLKNLRRTENGPGRYISTRSKLNGIPLGDDP